jgi:hypothetical protein
MLAQLIASFVVVGATAVVLHAGVWLILNGSEHDGERKIQAG